MNTPDMTKVKAALEKYAAPILKPKRREKLPALDTALRKPMRGAGRTCSGFQHAHFLNNEPQ